MASTRFVDRTAGEAPHVCAAQRGSRGLIGRNNRRQRPAHSFDLLLGQPPTLPHLEAQGDPSTYGGPSPALAPGDETPEVL